MAERKGVSSSNIETSPVHYMVKRAAVAWTCMEICFDHYGKNNIETPEFEKYKLKYEDYKQRLADFESMITAEMLSGNVASRRDRATLQTGLIFRG